jgi:hypothetical protein
MIYCKYCGCQHEPRQDFKYLQKNCPYKPKKKHMTSLTSTHPLLNKLKPREQSDHQHDIDIGDVLIEESMIIIQEDASIVPYDLRLLEWIFKCLKRIHINLGIHDVKTVDIGIITGNIMIILLKCFLNDLIKATIKEANSIKEEEPEPIEGPMDDQIEKIPKDRMMTPLHVYKAIRSKAIFDFLTHKYMGR